MNDQAENTCTVVKCRRRDVGACTDCQKALAKPTTQADKPPVTPRDRS